MRDKGIYASGEIPALGDIVSAGEKFGNANEGDKAQVIVLNADGHKDCIQVKWLTDFRISDGWFARRYNLISRAEGTISATKSSSIEIKPKCTCDFRKVVMVSGCACGAFDEEMKGKK